MIEKEFFFPRSTKIAILLPILDLVIIFLFLALITKLYDNSWNDQYAISGLIACFSFIFIGNYIGLYDKFLKPPTRRYRVNIFFCWSLAFLLTVSLSFIRKNTAEHSRVILIIWWWGSFLGVILVHFVWHQIINFLQKKGRYKVNIALAGDPKTAYHIIRKIDENKQYGINIPGIYQENNCNELHKHACAKKNNAHNYVAALGGYDRILEDAQNGVFDILFITLPLNEENRIKKILTALRDTTVSIYIVPDSFVFDLMHGTMMSFNNIPIIEIFDSPFYGVNSYIKRVEDLLLTCIIAPFIIPLMIIVSIAIKLTSKGPVFFRQKRYGLDGKVITIFKFRSMKVCEDGDKIVQAKKNDYRMTVIGSFLRRTSLDELPQFINVLFGQLSVIGPRPHAVAHNEMYRKIIDGYMMRHKVKPGITGWAQVNGYRGETRDIELMRKRVHFDIEYIKDWSIIFDVQIIFRTIWVIITGINAY